MESWKDVSHTEKKLNPQYVSPKSYFILKRNNLNLIIYLNNKLKFFFILELKGRVWERTFDLPGIRRKISANLFVNKNRHNSSKYLIVSMDGLNVSADPWFVHFRLATVLTELHGDAATIVPKNKNLLKKLNTVRNMIFVIVSNYFIFRLHSRWENYKIIGILLNLPFNIWWSLRTHRSVLTVDLKTQTVKNRTAQNRTCGVARRRHRARRHRQVM